VADQGPTRETPWRFRLILIGMRATGFVLPGLAARMARALFRDPQRHPRKDWEIGVEASATRGTTREHQISYLHWRPDQVRLRVAAIHGWEGRSTQFGPLAQFLLPLGVEFVAIDGPAHGASTGRHADPLIFSAALMEVVDELGPFDVLMGHSMGAGSVIISIARGVSTKKVVYFAGPAAFQEVLHRFADLFGMNARTRARFFALIEQASGRRFEGNDLESLVREFHIPALIVHDTGDPDVPYEDALRLQRAWPGAHLHTTTGLGHKALLRDPETMQVVADFLLAEVR
jgi:pimeloyl-ACP methyl ester carboxylesterase